MQVTAKQTRWNRGFKTECDKKAAVFKIWSQTACFLFTIFKKCRHKMKI